MWWQMPSQLSAELLEKYHEGCEEASYIWDWKSKREGTWQMDGEPTSINRYIVNFRTMSQQNIDTHSVRRIQIVSVGPP